MARAHHQRTPGSCIVGVVGALVAAAPAAAVEGNLQVFPVDSFGDLFSLRLFTYPFVYLIALFVVLIWPSNRLLWRPLLRVLDERRGRIAGARAHAEKLNGEAQDVLASYEAAVERARHTADAGRARVLEEARAEQSRLAAAARRTAEDEVTAAREAVASALERARAELRTAAEELGREAAARVLGRPLA